MNHTGYIASANPDKIGTYIGDLDEPYYPPPSPPCPDPTGYVDALWIDWYGDNISGWTPTFYISNGTTGTQDVDSVFWWLSIATKNMSWDGIGGGDGTNGQYWTIEDLEAGIDLSMIDGDLSYMDNCHTSPWSDGLSGWTLIARLQTVHSCESPPEGYYGTGHPYCPYGCGGNMSIGTPICSSCTAGYTNGIVHANVPCTSNPVYEVTDCADSSTWYIEDDVNYPTINTAGTGGEYVSWYDSNYNPHCGQVVATNSATNGHIHYGYTFTDCADCNNQMIY